MAFTVSTLATFLKCTLRFLVILLLKTQERSQLLGKSHRHIRLHATCYHRRCSVFVLNGYGGTLRLRIAGEIKEKIDWLHQNSFTDQRFVSSLKHSFHFMKYLTHDVMGLLVVACCPANNAMQGPRGSRKGCPYGTRTDLAAGAAVVPYGLTARV